MIYIIVIGNLFNKILSQMPVSKIHGIQIFFTETYLCMKTKRVIAIDIMLLSLINIDKIINT